MSEPDPISFKEHVFDFSFHPSNDLVAVGLINGVVECYKYSSVEPNALQWSTQASKKSCRGVEFTQDGYHLMSISRDKSIQALDVTTGRLLYKIPKAHKYAINKICKLDTHLTATGDDEGIIKIWDMRTCKSIQEYHVHQDFISDFCYHETNLLSVAGDGLLSIHDIRKPNENISLTNDIEDELLSMTMITGGDTKKVISGSQSGALFIWDWNQWDNHKKWIGHPSSVDSICKLDENAICTGGSDGLLRMISIQPKQNFDGILGDHGQDFPIESVQMNYNNTLLASCGHDLKLRFWNIQFLFEDDDDDDEVVEVVMDLKRRQQQDHYSDESTVKRSRGQFFENML